MAISYLSRFLILGARSELSLSEKLELLNLYHQLSDDQIILERLEEEGLIGLVYHHLKTFSSDIAPDFFSTLKSKALVYAARQARIIEEMLHLSFLMSKKNIRWVVIKGLSLAHRFYPEPYWRPFFDVDLIVHPEDGEILNQMLTAYELKPALAPHFQPSLKEKTLKNKYWLYRPLYRKGDLILEVHFGFPLLHHSSEGEEDFWSSREKFPVGQQELPCLAPEYELSLLCLHLQQHSYSRLIWLTDIVQLIGAGRVDWNKVDKIAQRENIKGSLAHTFSVINQLWPEAIPEETRPLFYLTSAEKYLFRLFFPLNPILTREKLYDSPAHTPTFLQLLGQHSLKTWVKTLKNFFFPPTDWVAYYYGLKPWSFKFLHHYLWRLVRPFVLVLRRLF